jgi:hypothetical protein
MRAEAQTSAALREMATNTLFIANFLISTLHTRR